MTVVLWRHAPTPANAAGKLQGQTDTSSGEEGLALGRVAAARLLEMYGVPAAVFSSPLRRAAATAELLGLPVTVEPGVNQRSYGIWEGMSIEDVARDFPEQLALRDAGGDPDIPGWETGEAVGKRVSEAIEIRADEVCQRFAAGSVARTFSDESAIASQASPRVGSALHNPAATGAAEASLNTPVVVFASHGSAIATGLRRLLGLPEEPQIFGYLHHANWVELQRIDGVWKVERYDYGVS